MVPINLRSMYIVDKKKTAMLILWPLMFVFELADVTDLMLTVKI